MSKRTTTQWTTTTTRTSDAKMNTRDNAELDSLFDGFKWQDFIKQVDDMPLGYAVQLRDKLNSVFGGRV